MTKFKSGKNTVGYPKNDELYTPKYIFDDLNVEFDLDVCAPHNGPLNTPTKKHICSCCGDGLNDEWNGFIFMNPPYSKPAPWVERFIAHGNGIAVLPINGNGKWVRTLWNSEAKVILMPPNVPFIDPQGVSRLAWYAISIWGIGDKALDAMSKSSFGCIR